MEASPTPARPTQLKPSPLLIGGGVLVIAIGFGLPRLFTGPSPDPAPSPPPAETKPASTAVPSEGPSLGMALGRLVVSFAVVAGLCVVAARVVGRRAGTKSGNMEVVASLAVGPRCAVHLVRSGDRRLLIGTDPGGVKALVELPARMTEPAPDLPEPNRVVAGRGSIFEPVPLSPSAVAADREVVAALLARERAA